MKTLESFAKAKIEKDAPSIGIEVQSIADGFVIDDIELKDFMRYTGKSDSITFPQKLTVITGKTGAGKTSILDAVTYALYNKSSRTDIQAVKTSDICQAGGYVKISFFQRNERYEVKRGFATNRSPYLTLKKNGDLVEGNIRQLDKIIRETIGLDYDGFRNSTFIRQEEMRALGAARGADRLEIFQKLFRLEIFEKAHRMAERKLKDNEFKIKQGEEGIRVREEQTKKLGYVKEEVEKVQIDLKKANEKVNELMKDIVRKGKRFDKLVKEHEDFIRMQTKIFELKKEGEKIKSRLGNAEAEEKEVKKFKEKLSQLEKEMKDYEEKRSEYEGFKQKKQKDQSLKREKQIYDEQKEKEINEYKQTRELLKKRIEGEEGRIIGLSTEIDKEQAFGLLRKEGILFERIERIEKEVKWLAERKDIVEEIKKERIFSEEELKEVSAKTKAIDVDSFVLSEIRKNIAQIKKDIEEKGIDYRNKMHELKVKLNDVHERIKEIGFRENEERKLNSLKTLLIKKQKQKEELEKVRKELESKGDVSKLIDDLIKQLNEKEKELKKMEESLERLKKEEEKYLKVKDELDKLKEGKIEREKEIHGKRIEIKNLRKQIKELEEVKERIKEVEKELRGFREKNEIYSLLKEQVFHKKGIVMYAINQLLPQLEIETSQNLADLTDGRFSKVILESYMENNRYGIRILVEGADKRRHDVQEFSGGERTQINAALRFAIAKQLAGLPQVGRTFGRMKTLFIDEGDLGSLDTESSRQLFVQKLFDMSRFFDKVILITHLSDVAEQFPGKINVYMTDDQESRIQVGGMG